MFTVAVKHNLPGGMASSVRALERVTLQLAAALEPEFTGWVMRVAAATTAVVIAADENVGLLFRRRARRLTKGHARADDHAAVQVVFDRFPLVDILLLAYGSATEDMEVPHVRVEAAVDDRHKRERVASRLSRRRMKARVQRTVELGAKASAHRLASLGYLGQRSPVIATMQGAAPHTATALKLGFIGRALTVVLKVQRTPKVVLFVVKRPDDHPTATILHHEAIIVGAAEIVPEVRRNIGAFRKILEICRERVIALGLVAERDGLLALVLLVTLPRVEDDVLLARTTGDGRDARAINACDGIVKRSSCLSHYRPIGVTVARHKLIGGRRVIVNLVLVDGIRGQLIGQSASPGAESGAEADTFGKHILVAGPCVKSGQEGILLCVQEAV